VQNNTIKVLHTEWSDGWGGQEIRIINEMLAVREQGIEVYLACRELAQIKQKALKHNIKVFTLPFDGAYDLKTIFALRRIIKRHKIDIVNTHSGKDTWTGGLAAKLAGVKFIRTRHLSNPINPSRFNFINELADFIFTTGEIVKDTMIQNNRINSKKIMSVPTGIDSEIFNPKKYDKQECRKIFNIKKDEIAIGILAVIRSFKRHDIFIETAKKLLYKYNNLKFFIAGDGPKKKQMEELIKKLGLEKNIIFLGHINNPEILLCALDILVSTSDSNEGVSQTIMQALKMNKKVVATNAGSIKDLHTNDNFKLVEVNNTDKIAGAIEYYLSNNLKTMPRDHIIKKFSKKVMAKKTIEIYNKVLHND
jgi:glycosyltransferase involved in cell wall biosynthesis